MKEPGTRAQGPRWTHPEVLVGSCVDVCVSPACLPSEISQLKKLETLSLNGNRIQTFPPGLGQLKALRSLSLSGNQISEFPSGLGSLRNLDLLDLSRNKIQNVPLEVSELQAIEINLNQNQVLESVPLPEPASGGAQNTSSNPEQVLVFMVTKVSPGPPDLHPVTRDLQMSTSQSPPSGGELSGAVLHPPVHPERLSGVSLLCGGEPV